MASIRPFSALRYAAGRVRPEDVLTQPYDKISPAMYAGYLERSPYNLARLILPIPPSDSHGGSAAVAQGEQIPPPYTQAAERLQAWRREGVLRRDERPGIYPYRQTFIPPGSSQIHVRQGLIGLGRVEPYEKRIVFRHEQTLSGPKADRRWLLRATRAHFGQIFMLYGTPGQNPETEIWDRVRQPVVDITDEFGVRHELFYEDDAAVIGRLQQAMSAETLVIADGHHRYETALGFSLEARAGAAAPEGALPTDWVMMTFIHQESPGLVVLPTHRVVHGLAGWDARALLARLGQWFRLEPVAAPASQWREAWPRLEAKLDVQAAPPIATLAMAGDERLQALYLKPECDRAQLLAAYPAAQRNLDLALAHELILHRGLEMTPEAVQQGGHIAYLREADEALRRVIAGEAQMAMLVRAIPARTVCEVARSGGVMPQKATDFYPKLLSGLTIYATGE